MPRSMITFKMMLVVILGLLLPSAAVQGRASDPAAAVPPAAALGDPQAMEAFVDAFLLDAMNRYHIPGAVFVAVKDGALFFSKGYGYAAVDRRTPVVPERTLFNIGSVGKLFTVTAVMQLAERGLLRLDEPVNTYVDDIVLESRFDAPVTLAQLLTHTAGFEERVSGAWMLDPAGVMPLGDYLRANMPVVVLPPGQEISYSNHGFALAGYVVASVSGLPYTQYVEEKILAPLAMTHTTLRQPFPASLAPDMAVGYGYANDYVVQPVVYSNFPPAGGQVATATDMARFALAQLPPGDGDGAQLLQAATVQEMERRHFTAHPNIDGYAYGYAERMHGSVRALLKGGDAPGFAALLFLLPEEAFGFFVAFNAGLGQSPIRDELVDAFFDRYFPLTVAPVSTQSAIDLSAYTGKYRWNRYARTTVDKVLAPIQMLQLRVAANDDGTITLFYPSLLAMDPVAWAPLDPLLFRRVDGPETLAFRTDATGRISGLYLNLSEPIALEKVPWWETDTVLLTITLLLVLIFFSGLFLPLPALRRWRERGNLQRWPPLLAGLLALVNLIFIAGVGLVILEAQRVGVTLIAPSFRLLLLLPLLSAALSVTAGLLAVLSWRRRVGSSVFRMHSTLLAVAGICFIWFVRYWNLLGFHL